MDTNLTSERILHVSVTGDDKNDGSPLVLDSDYLDQNHPEEGTIAGPFASISLKERIKVTTTKKQDR